MKKICSPDAHRHDIQVFYFIMLFILTIGYIDKVYKSVSSKRKPTHPSVGNVCVFVVVVDVCVSWTETPGVHCCDNHYLPPRTSSGLPALSETVQGEDILFCFCKAELVVAL